MDTFRSLFPLPWISKYDEEDILEIVESAIAFYDSANKTQVNVKYEPELIEAVRKDAKPIANRYTAESNPEMDFSDRFLLTYDIDRMEEVRILSPMDERYRVPDTINEQAFALTMTAEQKKAYMEKVKRMAREAAVPGREKPGAETSRKKFGQVLAGAGGSQAGVCGAGGEGTGESGLPELLGPKDPVSALGHLGETGEELDEHQVILGSWSPEYEYDIVTEFPFGESGSDELPFG